MIKTIVKLEFVMRFKTLFTQFFTCFPSWALFLARNRSKLILILKVSISLIGPIKQILNNITITNGAAWSIEF